jgi:hypothetical protein
LASWLSLAALAALSGTALETARADDFRIHTKVFAADAKEPISENTTIFHGGLAYDFIEGSSECLVFDPVAGRIVLFHPQREQWAEISLTQLDGLVTEMKQKLAAREDDFAAFLASPKFQHEEGAAAGEVSFTASWMRYQVRAAAAPSDAAAAQYAAFSAQSTRLAALRRAPLLARAAVNDWLSQQKLIPQSVRLTTYSKDRAGTLVADGEFRSQHAIRLELSDDDLARVAKVPQWRAAFRRVGLTTYWAPAE